MQGAFRPPWMHYRSHPPTAMAPPGFSAGRILLIGGLLLGLASPLAAQTRKANPSDQAAGWGDYWTNGEGYSAELRQWRRDYTTAIRAKDYAKAVAITDRAIARDPSSATLLIYRSAAKRQLRRFNDAMEDLEAARRLAKQQSSRELLGFTFGQMSVVRLLEGRGPEAQTFFRQAIHESPNDPHVYNEFAWYLATAKAAEIRNGTEAVRLASRACELTRWDDASSLDTLAAAYAETGDFAAATKWQLKALALAASDKADATNLSRRLTLYKSHQPYRTE